MVTRDQFGRILSTEVQQSNSLVLVQNVTLAVAMNTGEIKAQLKKEGLRSFGPRKEEDYYFKQGRFC